MEITPINEILKEERVKKGITIEQVFYETHIPTKFVRMIEEGAWEKFPTQLHRKGFIRLYGKYLNIPDSVIEEGLRKIEKVQGDDEEKPESDTVEVSDKPTRAIPENFLHLLFLLFILFVIIFFLILYLLPE